MSRAQLTQIIVYNGYTQVEAIPPFASCAISKRAGLPGDRRFFLCFEWLDEEGSAHGMAYFAPLVGIGLDDGVSRIIQMAAEPLDLMPGLTVHASGSIYHSVEPEEVG